MFVRTNVFLAALACALLTVLPAESEAGKPPKNSSNQLPTIGGTPATTATVGMPYSFQPTAFDPEQDPLTFSVKNKPAWASFSSTTGRLSGTPTGTGISSDVVISVSDGRKPVSLPAFAIAVHPAANAAPTISATPATAVTAGELYALQPSANDADGDPLSFSVQNKPTWATFSIATGALSGTPSASQVGTYANIVISVSDGTASSALPAFAIEVQPAPNGPPTISGNPSPSVSVGQAYGFQPVASDPDGDMLTFSIANKPAWATFSAETGLLSGTPQAADVGTVSGITISVSDGGTSVSLPAFSIAVDQTSTGSAIVSWTPPTQNTDGSTLTDLAGYRILYGQSSVALTAVIDVPYPGLTSYVVENLAPATWYFAVKAYNSTGAESVPTSPVSVTVP